VVFFCQFCDVAKSGDGLCENLARFGYKQNMKVKFVEHLFFLSFFFINWLLYLKLCIKRNMVLIFILIFLENWSDFGY
jgi:hypothetical protein